MRGSRDRGNRIGSTKVFHKYGHRSASTALGALLKKDDNMLYWAAVFFVIALVAAIFGFGGIAAGAAGIAKILFFLFLIIFVVAAILGLTRRG